MENNLSKTSFKGSDSAYWGLAIITGAAAGLAYGFGSTILTVIGGLFGAFTIYGVVFDRFRKIELRNEQILISRGIFNKNKKIDLNQVVLTIAKDRGHEGVALLSLDLTKITDWKPYAYLQIRSKVDQKLLLEIYENDFEDDEYISMLQGIQHYAVEHCGTPLQKAQHTHLITNGYLTDDKKLKQELTETLHDAFRSVYQPFETLLSKKVVEELQAEADVLFQVIKQGNVLVYYRKKCFRENASSSSIQIAENLIQATRENLEVVDTRIASHEEVKTKLEKIIRELDGRTSLDEVASKLDELQQKNTQKPIDREDVALDAEIIEQIQQLTKHIHQTETLEKSMVLKEHIDLIKQGQKSQEEEEQLRKLNKRLE